MGEEVSTFVKFAIVSLIASIIVSTLMVVLAVGRELSNEFTIQLEQGVAHVTSPEIEKLATYEEPLPVAAAYTVLLQMGRRVGTVSGTVHGHTVTSIEDLSVYLKYKARVKVIYHAESGVYDIEFEGVD